MKESGESSENEAEERGDEIGMRKYEVRREINFFQWLEWKEGNRERERERYRAETREGRREGKEDGEEEMPVVNAKGRRESRERKREIRRGIGYDGEREMNRKREKKIEGERRD